MTEQELIRKIMLDLQDAVDVALCVRYDYNNETDYTHKPAYVVGHSRGAMQNAILELSKLLDV